uniref:Uncharacterized protein n=1 Tax=Ditylum brightwellii TaxID=49249 RepID=A0A7S4QGP6_9STRA
MNSLSLRRSQRRRHTTYKKGDLVEIVHDSGVFTGRLLRKASTSSPSNPRWIFAYLDGRRKNEEVPEKSLGKVVDSDSDKNSINAHKPDTSDKKKKKSGRVDAKKKEEEVDTSINTSSDDGDNSLNGKAAKAQGVSKTKPASNNSSGKKRDSGSSLDSQEQRISKKAKIVSFKQESRRQPRMTRVSTRSSARNNPTEELIIPPTELMPGRRGSRRGGARPTRKPEKNQEVVKVKMFHGPL